MTDIRPTAKWANRMLRPLTSIHHRLEKHHEILASIADSKARAAKQQDHSDDTDSSRSKANKPPSPADDRDACTFSDEESNDPAWIPGNKPVKRRRLRHNYSSRGQRNGARRRSRMTIRSPEAPKTLPGAIEIATPLITGAARNSNIPNSAERVSTSIRKRLFRNALPPSSAGEGAGVAEQQQQQQRKTARTNQSRFPAYQGSWKEVLDLCGDAGMIGIAHLLDRIFIGFLGNTRVERSEEKFQGRGARSLMSMSVRLLPLFIAEEQIIQDEAEPDDDVDMCDAYFTELEACYAPGGFGWQPLREAVRAQGVNLVSEMIQRGWVPTLAICYLLEQCLAHGEFDAFESLLSKYLAGVGSYGYPTAFDPPGPSGHGHGHGHCDDPVLVLRHYYSKAAGRRSFVFDELAKLLSRGVMPPEWMVTSRWKRCVDGAIRSLSTQDGDSAAATRLVEAAVLSAGGVFPGADAAISQLKGMSALRPGRARGTRASVSNPTSLPTDQSPCPIPIQDALSNMASSLVSALCGMCIARSQASTADERATGVKIRRTVQGLVFTVQRVVGMDGVSCEGGGPSYQSLRRGYVLLGDCIVRSSEGSSSAVINQAEPTTRHHIEAFFTSLASQQDTIRQLAEFVQQVFRYSGQTRQCDKDRTPETTRTGVFQLTRLTNERGVAFFLGKVAAETAMELAEITVDPEDHSWAVEIQEQIVSSQKNAASDFSKSRQGGYQQHMSGLYRWEESIEEWVEKTPAPRPKTVPMEIPSRAATAMAVTRPTTRPRSRPRSIPCSTSSTTSRTCASDDAASSITSSAPSVAPAPAPAPKRASSQQDDTNPAPRPNKRLRSTPPEIFRRGEQRSDSLPILRGPPPGPGLQSASASASESESVAAPVAARTRRAARSALRELPGATNLAPASSSSRIEVVIVNHRHERCQGQDLPDAKRPELDPEPKSKSKPEPVAVRTRSARASLPARFELEIPKTETTTKTKTKTTRRVVSTRQIDNDSSKSNSNAPSLSQEEEPIAVRTRSTRASLPAQSELEGMGLGRRQQKIPRPNNHPLRPNLRRRRSVIPYYSQQQVDDSEDELSFV